MARTLNERTEHAATIVAAGEFRPRSFRRKRIAPGVSIVIAKRPGARTTETAAVRFDAREFTPDQARAWLARNGYTPRKFEAANPEPNAPAPATTPNVTLAGDNPIDISPERQEQLRARLAELRAEYPKLEQRWSELREAAIRAHGTAAWSEAKARLHEAFGALEVSASEQNRIRYLLMESEPSSSSPAQNVTTAGAEPNPRNFVELGRARELVVDTGRAYSWTIGDDWRVLTPSGAEHLAAGQGRLFIVPPPPDKRGTPAPEPTAAAETFERWHGFEPGKSLEIEVPLVEEFVTPLGKSRSIVYRSHKWDRKRKDYEHLFSRRLPPDVLIVGSVEAPRAVLVRGGEFRVTSRGLVD